MDRRTVSNKETYLCFILCGEINYCLQSNLLISSHHWHIAFVVVSQRCNMVLTVWDCTVGIVAKETELLYRDPGSNLTSAGNSPSGLRETAVPQPHPIWDGCEEFGTPQNRQSFYCRKMKQHSLGMNIFNLFCILH